MLVTTGVIAGMVAVYASAQSVLVLGVFSEELRGKAPTPALELAMRVGVNLIAVAVVVLGAAITRIERRPVAARIALVIAIALSAALVRAALQLATGIYAIGDGGSPNAILTEIVTSTGALSVALVAGLLHHAVWRRSRHADRTRIAAQDRATALLGELQDEELRVRREVAHTIHGSVQNVFVVLEAQLDDIGERVPGDESVRLAAVREHLRMLREGELRELSSRLYPVDLERGLVAAVRTLAARAPAHVTVDVPGLDAFARVSEAAAPPSTQVLIARLLEEAIANALRHGRARRITVDADLDGRDRLTLVIDNDGEPPSPDATPSGLERLRRHVELLDGALTLTEAPDGGARLSASFALHPAPGGASSRAVGVNLD
jgi:two-component system, NarL family, sensor histidine kinase UhpB